MSSIPEPATQSTLPHDFAVLRAGTRPPMLIAGAGLSFGMVPLPVELLRTNKEAAELELGCGEIRDLPEGPDALYEWAETILDRIRSDGGTPPKLRLAKAIGLLSDPRWTAKVETPLRGTMPRHRVIARMAREEKWASIWSLNWDCHLENALECVGFKRGQAREIQPWLTRYDTIVISEDFQKLGDRHVFCVLKPHGCVQSLVEADEAVDDGDASRANELSDRFMICSSELNQERINPTDTKFFARMRTHLHSGPLVIVGWSVSEPYLVSVIDDALAQVIARGKPEELSIIDVEFNASGHTKISEYYALDENQVHFPVSTDTSGFDTDALFLWLQAKYCLEKLASHSPSDDVKAKIDVRSQTLVPSATSHYLLKWADDFLPAWTRLCWRAEVVSAAGFDAHELALDRPDEHIPWSLTGLPRPDLAAASILLSQLPEGGGDWDFSMYPGALWDPANLRLVVPLPTWGRINDLAALRPMSREPGLGFIRKVELLPLHSDPEATPPSADDLHILKEKLARTLSLPGFAVADNIDVTTDIRGGREQEP